MTKRTANDATTSERLLRLVEWNTTQVMPEKRDSPVRSSYQFEQLFGLQDVLLHLVCIGLHAGDQQSQVIGLGSGWKHKSQSAQVTLHKTIYAVYMTPK